jgi:hypothetical protein
VFSDTVFSFITTGDGFQDPAATAAAADASLLCLTPFRTNFCCLASNSTAFNATGLIGLGLVS